MRLSYRTRRRLRRLAVFTGYALLIAAVIWVCWIVWLQRFVVYTDQGAQLRFDYVSPEGTAQVATPPEEETVRIHYNEGDDIVNTSTELTQIRGYYATLNMLNTNGVEAVRDSVAALPDGSAVMLDMKNGYGTFYYTSSLSDAVMTTQVDTAQVDALIRELDESGVYLIARIPAFRDREYGLNHTNYGLAVPQGYLYAGSDNCYWLDPTSTGALTWIITIVNELRDMGFDEVCFTDFQFPNTDSLVFSGSRSEALEQAAQTLVTSCATTAFAVSFEVSNPEFNLPEGRSRMYLTGVDASDVAEVSETVPIADKEIRLVFLTETNDTRFDEYCAMRPMPLAG